MNKLRIRLMCLAVIAAGGLGASARADITMTFDTSVTLGAGGWTVDRYAPHTFASPSFFLGDNRLLQTIDGDDAQTGAFYNTQGRAYDVGDGIKSMSIDLYVSSDWAAAANDGHRFAGFWGTGVDGSNSVQAYPIIEFANMQTADPTNGVGFRIWDSAGSGGWINTGLPSGFTYNAFHNLQIDLVGNNFIYKLDGSQIGSVGTLGAVELSSVILQGYNTVPPGQNYTIYWDNFNATSTAAVPEPASVVSAMVGLAGMGLVALRRSRKAVA